MPKLDNVKVAADLTTIEYGGDTYYRLADGEELRTGDLAYVKASYVSFLTTGGVYELLGTREDGRFRYVDDDGSNIHGGRDNFVAVRIFFRKKSTAEILSAMRAEYEGMAAEIAELKAKMRAEIIGSVAFVTGAGYYGDIRLGTLVKVTDNADIDKEYPYKGELLDDSDFDLFDHDSLELVTYKTARAHLIAEVDRQLIAAFADRV